MTRRQFGALLAAGTACAQMPAGEREAHLASFDQVWTTVKEKHFDPAWDAAGWESARAELRPRVESAGDAAAVRAVLSELLARLKLTHFGIIPAEVYGAMGAAGGGDATPGLQVRVLGSDAVVTEVEPESAAARAGVAAGWRIARIAGIDVQPAIERVERQFAGSTLRDAMLARALLQRLRGPAGEAVAITFEDGRGGVSDISLAREAPRGRMAGFGFLPPQPVRFEFTRPDERFGVIRFNLFLDPPYVMTEFAGAVERCRDCRGLVLDLRGNPGGLGIMASGIAGWFVDAKGHHLGTLQMRGNALKLFINPRAETFPGRLAILIDGCSGSTAEILAGGLQDLKRARVFGSRSAGAALPSVVERLPNGDGFQYAVANYVSAGGRVLEGRGVIPDVPVALTRKALLAGRDPVLEAARDWARRR